MAETNLAQSARGDEGLETQGPSAPDARRGNSVNYEALRFPGCQRISL